MRSLIVVALSLSVLAAAGCSGSDDADPTTPTSGTAAPETSSTPPETDAPATTATTAATTTAPPTTEAPTTTLDPTAALIADIEADLNAGEQALIAAGADPGNPGLRDDVSKYFSATGLDRVNEFLDGLVREGLRTRPNPDVPNVIVVENIDESAGDGSVLTTICQVDAVVVYEPIGESEAIVDDQIIRSRTEVRLSPVDGIWISKGDGADLGADSGATECD